MPKWLHIKITDLKSLASNPPPEGTLIALRLLRSGQLLKSSPLQKVINAKVTACQRGGTPFAITFDPTAARILTAYARLLYLPQKQNTRGWEQLKLAANLPTYIAHLQAKDPALDLALDQLTKQITHQLKVVGIRVIREKSKHYKQAPQHIA